MSAITTHVLDTARGCPAAGVPVVLEFQQPGADWKKLGEGTTDADGRCQELLADGVALSPGIYRLTFDVESYFSAQGTESFYPQASVVFNVRDAAEHYHIPLLLSPFGYSTYRGS